MVVNCRYDVKHHMINQSNHALKNPCIDAKSYWREIIYLYGIQNYLNFVETNYNWQNYIFDRHRLVFNLFFDKTSASPHFYTIKNVRKYDLE